MHSDTIAAGGGFGASATEGTPTIVPHLNTDPSSTAELSAEMPPLNIRGLATAVMYGNTLLRYSDLCFGIASSDYYFHTRNGAFIFPLLSEVGTHLQNKPLI